MTIEKTIKEVMYMTPKDKPQTKNTVVAALNLFGATTYQELEEEIIEKGYNFPE